MPYIPLLRRIQLQWKPLDVFPTVYRITVAQPLLRVFPSYKMYQVNASAEPAYYSGYPLLDRVLMSFHGLLPSGLSTAPCFFIEKPSAGSRDP